MEATSLITALAPAFAAGFAIQRLLEILDPVAESVAPEKKKIVLGLSSLIAGLGFAGGAGLRVLVHLGTYTFGARFDRDDLVDLIVTGLVISAGTEGFNSILKFMNYKKEETRMAVAAQTRVSVNRSIGSSRTTMEDSMTKAENDEFTTGDAEQCAHNCAVDTGKAIQFDPSNTLGDYGLVTPELLSLYRKDIRTNNSIGLPSYQRTINPNALKDISDETTILEVAKTLTASSAPVPTNG